MSLQRAEPDPKCSILSLLLSCSEIKKILQRGKRRGDLCLFCLLNNPIAWPSLGH